MTYCAFTLARAGCVFIVQVIQRPRLELTLISDEVVSLGFDSFKQAERYWLFDFEEIAYLK